MDMYKVTYKANLQGTEPQTAIVLANTLEEAGEKLLAVFSNEQHETEVLSIGVISSCVILL